ncbi:MAG TPA: sulfonate ABC transporter permease [Clostridiales bacterium]|nr:sulfonate ABC transporter permease [Clostridiales bacterium]
MKKRKGTVSEEHLRYLKKERGRTIFVVAMQVFLLLQFFVVWEVLARFEVIDGFIFSSPSKMLDSFKSLSASGVLWKHVSATLSETVIGFLSATVIGLVVAVVLWSVEPLRRILEPYIVVLNALPKIALGPIIIIWVGAGKAAIVVMAILISVVITIINILNGFLSVDKDKILLMKTLSASRVQILFKLVLPSNLSNVIAALKVNVGMAWVGTIMGEYLVSREGLGYLIVYGGQVFNLSLVMCSTLILTILAAIMYFCVLILERLVAR